MNINTLTLLKSVAAMAATVATVPTPLIHVASSYINKSQAKIY